MRNDCHVLVADTNAATTPKITDITHDNTFSLCISGISCDSILLKYPFLRLFRYTRTKSPESTNITIPSFNSVASCVQKTLVKPSSLNHIQSVRKPTLLPTITITKIAITSNFPKTFRRLPSPLNVYVTFPFFLSLAIISPKTT